jgi:hypothetical protein
MPLNADTQTKFKSTPIAFEWNGMGLLPSVGGRELGLSDWGVYIFVIVSQFDALSTLVILFSEHMFRIFRRFINSIVDV